MLPQLKPGGKAAGSRDMRIGDALTHINTRATAELTHTQAEQEIKKSGDVLKLSLHRFIVTYPCYLATLVT